MSEDYDRKIMGDLAEAYRKKCDLDKLQEVFREIDAFGEDLTEDDVYSIIKRHDFSPEEMLVFSDMLARCYQKQGNEVENL